VAETYATPKDGLSPRQRLLRRWGALKQERSTWEAHWRDLSRYLLPRNGRFLVEDRNKGLKRHNDLLDGTATWALRVMAAGMMAGATSPARPWFKLRAQDPALNKRHDVQLWMEDATNAVQGVFRKAKTYPSLHQIYGELGCFGTGCNFLADDPKTVLRHHPITIGEYAIATDSTGDVNTVFREFGMTVEQMVEAFGRDNVSQQVRDQYDRVDYDLWHNVLHAIYPRKTRDLTKRDNRNMRFASCYVEVGGNEHPNLLRESGFEEMPAIVPRWDVAGGDIYGNSPGMEALGEVMGLQFKQLRLAKGIDYQTDPPLLLPETLSGRDNEALPGGRVYANAADAGTIKSLFEVRLDLSHLDRVIERSQGMVSRIFYADMFLMIANSSDTTQRTAAEIAERHEEKLVMLGPVLERQQDDVQRPLVDRAFMGLLKGGALPPLPPDLIGQELEVEFVSAIAQAQQAVGTHASDRFVMALGAVAALPGKQDVLDKFDHDEWADRYSQQLGVDPHLVISTSEVAIIRKARNDALAAKEQVAAVQQASVAARNLSASPTTGEPTALTDMFQGYGA
jgi:hypothetical protein